MNEQIRDDLEVRSYELRQTAPGSLATYAKVTHSKYYYYIHILQSLLRDG